ncbi:MAG: hypothetical protein GC181_05885 [Bacteroidetes bacterium]|nr:hypothetical protein [Bacteroidota bacterium]
MIKTKPALLIVLLCFGAGSVLAQNPGYAKKKMAFGIGSEVGIPDAGFTRFNPVLHLERSLSTRTAIHVYLSQKYFHGTGLSQTFRITDPYVLVDDPKYTPDNLEMHTNPSIDFDGMMRTAQLSIRRYRIHRGAIAPMGNFLDLGFEIQQIDFNEADVTGFGRYQDKDVFFLHTYDLGKKTNWVPLASLGFGRKRFLGKWLFLEYRVSTSFRLMRKTTLEDPVDLIMAKLLYQNFTHQRLMFHFTFGFAA